ncbi:hypothetical protein GW17_00000877 [Ensete ventricosum]|nr:hypothetical protein GW17_00000877 [Ensete ventricosum]RZS15149.1 hypothetical protein BHM03_00046937 [Ensete ventricosum]
MGSSYLATGLPVDPPRSGRVRYAGPTWLNRDVAEVGTRLVVPRGEVGCRHGKKLVWRGVGVAELVEQSCHWTTKASMEVSDLEIRTRRTRKQGERALAARGPRWQEEELRLQLRRRKVATTSKATKEEQRVALLAAIAKGWPIAGAGEQKASAAGDGDNDDDGVDGKGRNRKK